jgi:hypothetical protein
VRWIITLLVASSLLVAHESRAAEVHAGDRAAKIFQAPAALPPCVVKRRVSTTPDLRLSPFALSAGPMLPSSPHARACAAFEILVDLAQPEPARMGARGPPVI